MFAPYVSIDIETAGLGMWCSLLEVAAVIEDWKSPIESLPTFHCYAAIDEIHGEPIGLSMNANIIRIIGERHKHEHGHLNFYAPELIGTHLSLFLQGRGVDPKHVVAAGKNFSGFDRPRLDQLPGFSARINFKHRVMDPAMCYFDPMKDDAPPSTNVCMERACMVGESTHTAIQDARDVIDLIRRKYLPGHEHYECSWPPEPEYPPYDFLPEYHEEL